MSTNDVPGAKDENGDELAMGCWAEHPDGSLIFVESTEGDRVVYVMFDMGKQPIVEYRDAMDEKDFKKFFSWEKDPKKRGGKRSPVKWTWHDKTPFDWDRIVVKGGADGPRFASASDQLSAAERVAESLKLRGRDLSDRYRSQAAPSEGQDGVRDLMTRLRRALDTFLEG